MVARRLAVLLAPRRWLPLPRLRVWLLVWVGLAEDYIYGGVAAAVAAGAAVVAAVVAGAAAATAIGPTATLRLARPRRAAML